MGQPAMAVKQEMAKLSQRRKPPLYPETRQQVSNKHVMAAYRMTKVKDVIDLPQLQNLPGVAENPYYAFLYYLMGEVRPKIAVELGVYKGVSLAHMAAGWPDTQVIGVDIDLAPLQKNEACYRAVMALDNVKLLAQDSTRFLEDYDGDTIDILHIDTAHDYGQVSREFNTARWVVDGWIIVDDIDLPDVRRFWDQIPLPRLELHGLHATGYGVVAHFRR